MTPAALVITILIAASLAMALMAAVVLRLTLWLSDLLDWIRNRRKR